MYICKYRIRRCILIISLSRSITCRSPCRWTYRSSREVLSAELAAASARLAEVEDGANAKVAAAAASLRASEAIRVDIDHRSSLYIIHMLYL